MNKNNVNMLSGPITKGLISMTMPIMIMNVVQMLFNVVDLTALRFFADDNAVGAVGACGMLSTLCTSLLLGLSAGANVVVAKRIGAGDKGRTDKAVMTALLTAVVGGIILMIVGLMFAETFLKWINCPESLLKGAMIYFRIYFLSVPLTIFYNFCASILRATGDTKRPMNFTNLAGLLKMIFSILFLTLTDMTVEGVALATIAAYIVSDILIFMSVLHNKDVHIDFSRIKMDFVEFKEILFIGVPTGFQSAMYSFANTIIATVVNSFGAAATTGISIANQFDGILYHISCATSVAAIPYVAQNVGAKNIDRVKKTMVRAVIVTVGFGATFGAFSAIFSGQLSSIMSSSPEVIAYSRQKMIIISSTYFICGINEVMGGVLKGMGKPIIPTVATLVWMCLFRFVWVYGIYPLCPQNLTFLYLVWPIGWILSISTLLFAYFPAIKKLQKNCL